MDTAVKDRERIATKTFRAEVKAEAPEPGATSGTFEARVAAFGNVDLQNDRIEPGAFDGTKADWEAAGDPVPVIWSHQWDDPMAHIGSVSPSDLTFDENGVNVRGVIDLENPTGRQVHRLMVDRRVKEFSFAYVPTETEEDGDVRVLKALDLIEVGPTLKGANPSTELFGAKKALARHTTGTDDGAWDAALAERRLPNSAAALAAAHAWRDPDGDPDAKSTYKFVHHFVGEDGRVGAASLVASSASIGILNGGRGGSSIPDADRQGVFDHVAGHLRDADREPPELRSVEDLDAASGSDDDDEKAGGPAEAKYGRVLSKANETKLRQAGDLIGEVLASLASSADDGASSDDGKSGSGADRGEGRSRDTAEAAVRLLELGGPL
jgi:HK97 family phage prohead protease